MKAEYDFSNARPNPYVDKLNYGKTDADSSEERVSSAEDLPNSWTNPRFL